MAAARGRSVAGGTYDADRTPGGAACKTAYRDPCAGRGGVTGRPRDSAGGPSERRGLRVMIEATPSELIRRIVLLEIAAEGPAAQRPPGAAEDLARLVAARDATLPAAPELDELTDALREILGDLRAVRDDLRSAEAQGHFDDAFVTLARAALQLEAEQARIEARLDAAAAEALEEDRPHPSA